MFLSIWLGRACLRIRRGKPQEAGETTSSISSLHLGVAMTGIRWRSMSVQTTNRSLGRQVRHEPRWRW
jgi:hypothetical protein